VRNRHRLLLAEGSTSDAALVVGELTRAGWKLDVQRITTAAQMETALEARPWDFIIFGDHLPGFDWETAWALCKSKGLDIPFIIVSGITGSDRGVERIKAGVHEYLSKQDLVRLPQTIRRELRAARERRIRQYTETVARLVGCNLDFNPIGVIGLASDDIIVSWNTGAERLFGYSASEMIGCSVSTNLFGQAFTVIKNPNGSEQGTCVETIGQRNDASPVRLQIVAFSIYDLAGRVIGTSVVVRDSAQGEAWSQIDLTMLADSATRSFPAIKRINGGQ